MITENPFDQYEKTILYSHKECPCRNGIVNLGGSVRGHNFEDGFVIAILSMESSDGVVHKFGLLLQFALRSENRDFLFVPAQDCDLSQASES